MYESFYNFREKPFSLLPDPSFLYLGKKHSLALSMLQYGLANQAGITVITGEIGCGKTTLIRHILSQMEKDITVGLITNTHRTFGELLQWVLLAFDLEYREKEQVERYQTFVDFVISEYAQNRYTVLIVDEAQNMDRETIEELRMLSNINADKHQVLQLVLVGQPELRTTLRRHDLRQFAQRISVDYHLEALDAAETREYVRHRIELAGGLQSIFLPESFELIYRYSKGIPRSINILCDTALVYAFGQRRRRVTAALLREVVSDKARCGLFDIEDDPNEHMTSARKPTAPLPQIIGVGSAMSRFVNEEETRKNQEPDSSNIDRNAGRKKGKRSKTFAAERTIQPETVETEDIPKANEPTKEFIKEEETEEEFIAPNESVQELSGGDKSLDNNEAAQTPDATVEHRAPTLTFPSWVTDSGRNHVSGNSGSKKNHEQSRMETLYQDEAPTLPRWLSESKPARTRNRRRRRSGSKKSSHYTEPEITHEDEAAKPSILRWLRPE